MTNPRYDERNTKIAEMYGQGMTMQQVADELHMTRQRVQQILNTLEIKTRERNFGRMPTEDILEAWVIAYEAGTPSTVISAEYGYAPATILRYLREMGIPIRPKGTYGREESLRVLATGIKRCKKCGFEGSVGNFWPIGNGRITGAYMNFCKTCHMDRVDARTAERNKWKGLIPELTVDTSAYERTTDGVAVDETARKDVY